MPRLLEMLQHLSTGWRLLACLCIGAAIFLWPFEPDDPMVHAGAAWFFGVLLFLGWTAYAVQGVSIAQLRKRARDLDDSAWVVSLLVVIAALISLLGLGLIIYGKGDASGLVLGLRLGFARSSCSTNPRPASTARSARTSPVSSCASSTPSALP